MHLFSGLFKKNGTKEQPVTSKRAKFALPDFLIQEAEAKGINGARQAQLLGKIYKIMRRYSTTSRVDEYLRQARETPQTAPWKDAVEHRFVTQILHKHAGRGLRPLNEEVAERIEMVMNQSFMMPQNGNLNDIIGGGPFVDNFTPVFPFKNINESLVSVVTGQEEWAKGFVYGLAEREELCEIAQEIVNLCRDMMKHEKRVHPTEKTDLKDALVDLMADKERVVVNDKIHGFERFTQEKETFCWLSALTYVEHLEGKSPRRVQKARRPEMENAVAEYPQGFVRK